MKWIGAGLVSVVLACPVWGEPVTETFEQAGGAWRWAHFADATGTTDGGAASVDFRPTFLPVPVSSTLVSEDAASGSPFTGDYLARGIQLIGFRFQAVTLPDNPEPLSVELQLEGDGLLFSRSFVPAAAGVWYTFTADVTDARRGGWQALQGTLADFDALRRDVRAVKIRLMGSAPDVSHAYLIDDVYLDYAPSLQMQADPAGGLVMAVHAAREQQGYRLQVSEDLAAPGGGWQDAPGVWSATGRVMQIDLPTVARQDDRPAKYYRIVLDE